VLLGESSGEEEARHLALLEALSDESQSADVKGLLIGMSGPDLLRRDEDGNMPLHVVRGPEWAEWLQTLAPEMRDARNADGRNPLNEQLVRNPDGLPPGMLGVLTGKDDGAAREVLLSRDAEGVCAAMRLQGDDLKSVRSLLPDWELVCDALGADVPEILPRLEALGGKDWPGLLSLHCFRDVLAEGTHTAASWERLGIVWKALSRALRGCLTREAGALEAAKALLQATKGPLRPPVDMRLPYKHALDELMHELRRSSGEVLAANYERLDGPEAQWLKSDLCDGLSPELAPDELASHGLQPRLRMDFRLQSGGGAPSAVRPAWVTADTPELDKIYADLKAVGMLGHVRKKDAAYDMLRLGGMGEVEASPGQAESLWVTRCYAAHLRGVCQGQLDRLGERIQAAVGDLAVLGETLFLRKEAKRFPRLMEKTLQRVEEIGGELRELDVELGARALRQAAASICDINGVTLVGDTPQKLRALYERLAQSFRLLRTKNTYLEAADNATDYRDLKAFIAVDCGIGELVVEVQLILADDYNEKQWIHLPYVYARGDMEWHHSRTGASVDNLFNEGWRLCHGIQGSMSRHDMRQAERLLVSAAVQGHFVARGLCHTNGWGAYQQDSKKAVGCFVVAAEAADGQAGKPEAKCRLGAYYLGAVKDVMTCRRRGVKLLEEAAGEGEPEAAYQLSTHGYDYDEQRRWLKVAADLGHKKAVDKQTSSIDIRSKLRSLDI